MEFVFLLALVVIALCAAAVAVGYTCGLLYGWWKDRMEFVRYTRIMHIVGTPAYQWKTVQQAVLDAGVHEFQAAKRDGDRDDAALILATAAIFKVMSRRWACWNFFRTAVLPDPTAVIEAMETEKVALRVENFSLKKDLQAHRVNNAAILAELVEVEEIAMFLVSERTSGGGEVLPYYGHDLDAVRLRMGKMPKSRPVSVDDLLIDAARLTKWVDSLQATGIEPPPAFFQLKKHLAGVRPH